MKIKRKITIIYLMSILFALIILSPITVHAEEVKELSIPFVKDYKEANFSFSFTDKQMHHIVIVGPDGSETTKDSESEEVLISVKDVVSGTYNITITAEEPIEVVSTVEGIVGTVKEVGETSIDVSHVISGVEVYYIDGDLCIKWDDAGIGKVNVKVTNPATMQVIYNDTVSSNTVRVPLPSNLENVEFHLVAASEAKIDGAGITLTKPVVTGVPGSIEVPQIKLTNIETVTFNGSFETDMEVIITDNGDKVFDIIYEPGDYEITAPLNGINNNMIVTLIDINTNNQITYEFDVTKDMIAPTLSFSEEYNNLILTDNHLVISGTMKSGNALYVNNTEIEYETNGAFECEVPLSVGENTIAVCAVDDAGNECPVIFTVTRNEVKKSNKSLYLLIGTVLVFVILIAAAVIKVVTMKKKGNDEPENLLDNNAVEPSVKENKKKESLKKTKEESNVQKVNSLKASSYYKERRKFEILVDFLPIVLSGVVLISVFVIYLQIAIIPSGSMEPTLETGAITLFNKFAYKNSTPQRGDIIYFDGIPYSTQGNKFLTKRVIGIAGDEITFKNGDVYINGLKAEESYISEDIDTNSSNTFVVPEGCVFVMGDNRENSIDSRFFTNPYVSCSDVKGKYFGSFYFKPLANLITK